MTSRPRHETPRDPAPPDRGADASDDRLLTSSDLFGELVDSPPDDGAADRTPRRGPIRVQVTEPKSLEVRQRAEAEPPAAASLGAEEMATLLDVFDLPPAPARPAAESAATPAAPAASSGAPPDLDARLDAPAKPAPAPARGAPRLPFGDASEFESLLDKVLTPAAPAGEPPAPPALGEDGGHATDPAPPPPDETAPARFRAKPPRALAAQDEVDLLGLAESAFEAGTALPAAPPPERLVYGPYRLLERIATGGMAEVFRAKRTGVEGFEKVVAVKRILGHLSDNKEFVDMFVDEAKMVAGLAHPNIVQIFDLGRIGKSYFIAMEYVHGRDLRTIHKRAKERGVRIPLDLSALIVSRVCAALESAHRKKDDRGQPLQIVHRDVSPQNILISFEGEVKLTDFGIAKAQSKATITDRGSLRGKLLYMSPEQASGKPIDRRSDLFALGIVFYELVTGERPFAADSERSILESVRECRVRPPRALNPRIPERLESVVMKALARDPDERYQDAAEMQRDIERVMRERQVPAAPELARLMELLFDEREHEEPPGGSGADASGAGDAPHASGDHDVEFDHAPAPAAGDDLSIEALMKRFGIRPAKEA
jgi:serine/threonine protein kinase